MLNRFSFYSMQCAEQLYRRCEHWELVGFKFDIHYKINNLNVNTQVQKRNLILAQTRKTFMIKYSFSLVRFQICISHA